MKLQQREGRVC